ncbi:MAG: DNA alkylation repair protein, partial [Candidatus Woesearchaeota archaeon]
ANDKDPNVRRTSSEGLRDVARKAPKKVLPIIEKLKKDDNLYVKKSVANVLRNASRYDPDFVLDLCKKWLKVGDSNTNWIIKDGLRKLKTTHTKEVQYIISSIK